MGSVLGGGSSGSSSSSKAINSSAAGVATAAQQGGATTSAAINNASQTSANSILQGTQTAANQALAGSQTAANLALSGSQVAAGGALNGGQIAANASWQGAQTSAEAQQQALNYLQQQDALPSSLRTSALNSLGQLYGGSGSITDRAMASPLYQAAVQQGENSVLRNASATGGLRSGNAQDALATVNQNALVSAYNDQLNGLQGLASLQSNANNIASYQAGIGNTLGQGQISYGQQLGQGQAAYSQLLGQGQATYGQLLGQGQATYGQQLGQGQVASAQTLAQGQISSAEAIANANNAAATAVSQGQIAAAQNSSQASQNSTNNMFGLAGLGMQAFSTFSDRRLKTNIRYIGEENGHRKYSWDWNEKAAALGLHGASYGVIADEVASTHPHAVSTRSGYQVVDYSALGVSHGI